MKQNTITIQGNEYPVQYDLQTILNFEEIVEHSIFTDNLTTTKSRIALIMAAVLSADKDTDLTIASMMGDKSWDAAKQILTAYMTIDSMAADFFKIPQVESDIAEAEKQEQDENEKQPKN